MENEAPENVTMQINRGSLTQSIERTLTISSQPEKVWQALTDIDPMKQWMGDLDMHLEIHTDWKEGHPIVIKGFHHVKFENKGTVLQVKPKRLLAYNYVSSLSRLPDIPENRTTVEFRITQVQNQTKLTLSLSNFPTEAIYKHVDFYWSGTLEILKNLIERELISAP